MDAVRRSTLETNTLGQVTPRMEPAWGQPTGSSEPKIPLANAAGKSERMFLAAIAILNAAGVKVVIKSTQERSRASQDDRVQSQWKKLERSTRENLKRVLQLLKQHVKKAKVE